MYTTQYQRIKGMQVKFFLSNNNLTARQVAFREINQSKRDNKIIILTPDRNTMNIEKSVLQDLGTKSIFGVNVTTFSRLAKSGLQSKNLYKNVLTKHASVALIKRILLKLKNELKVFQKNIEQEGFCEKIFETICLYKSCNIRPADVYVTQTDDYLEYKLHDIQLIYSEYEKYLNDEYTDSFNQLDLYEKSITKEDVHGIDFFLVDFEDITPAIARVVAKLAKYARSFNICTTYSKSVKDAKNKNIFTNDIYYNLASILDSQGVTYDKVMIEPENRNNLIMSKNIFGNGKVTTLADMNLRVIKSSNVRDEVSFVATDIKKAILDGKYNVEDVAIVVSDMDSYKETIEEMFNKVDLQCYFDQSKHLSDNVLCKIILAMLEFACNGLNKYTLIKLIDTNILRLTMAEVIAYKSYVTKINANGKYLIEIPDKLEVTDDLVSAVAKIKSAVGNLSLVSGNVEYYQEAISNLLSALKFDEYYEMLYSKYIDLQDVINAKELTQSYNKLSTIWQEMSMLFKNEEFSPKEFYEIFKTFVSDVAITLPPIKVGSVVVSDFATSYLSQVKAIYFVGASDGDLPKYAVETALLSDKELCVIEKQNRLTPSINLINKRKKFKLYESVLKAQQSLVFSYVAVDGKGEEVYCANVVNEIKKCVTSCELIDASENIMVESDDATVDKVVQRNISKKMAYGNIVDYIKEWDVYSGNTNFRTLVSSVYHSIDDKDIDIISNAAYTNNVTPITSANKLYFRSGETSPSQFETFARCPYAHFLAYGLKLREQESGRIANNDIGNIIHEYLKNTIFDINNYRNDNEFVSNIKSFVKTNLDQVIGQSKYIRFVSNNANASTINSLYPEIERMTIAIIEQLRNSSYEPKLLEHNFNKSNNGAIAISLTNGKTINVTGKVDRIDVNEKDKTFLVIDYKTGNSSFNNFTDFVAGKKIQLFTYMLLYSNSSNYTPVGAFYLPINNKIEKTQKYRYQGFFVKDSEVVGNIDHKLREVSANGITLRLSTNKEGGYTASNVSKNLMIDRKVLDSASHFLVDTLNLSACKIMEGYIDVVPLMIDSNSACKHCKYHGICNFNRRYGNKYRKVQKVASLSDVFGCEQGGGV